MEPEKEPQRPTPQRPEAFTRKSYQAQPTQTYLPIKKTYAREVCVVAGIVFLIFGLVGFVVEDLLGAHLSYTHNAIHVASGILATWFGFDSEKNARRFCFAFGTFYGLLGVFGFAFGVQGLTTVGRVSEDRYLWKAVPGILELGTADHIIHLVFAVAFILGALLTFKRFQKI